MSTEPNGAAARKADHIRVALEQQRDPLSARDYNDVEFIYHALGAINRESVDLTTEVAGSVWQHPLYINAMTGGIEQAAKINKVIAEAAAATGIAVASGSLGMALDLPETRRTFTVLRELNPHGFVCANIGAGRSLDDAKRAVEMLHANALQIHLNAVQETVMPEGECDFETWLPRLEEIVNRVQVPVIVKEVGCGLSRRTLRTLRNIGVQIADVSGKGGTNFAQIEASRRADGYADLAEFGQSAVCSLLDAPEFHTLLASGGVKSPLDAIKLLALGARGVGVAGAFLTVAAADDPQLLIERVDWWVSRLHEISALLGAASVAELARTDLLIRGSVREYCQLRGIDLTSFTRRSNSAHVELSTAAEGIEL
ncbi:type 2 isopentenyl-diphosphate Delta-isomerase [Canibacter sp. lx-72]|uniref:type 2 isopentenyl-diphosphate Delta-isomerase n=1 Tax=Canibacter zhuwentaonis TaxID=2837491 RepID=UPI001BDDA389|nr:type 2 isopentenyl-diphosphate Delta-isomerase [Canibacter zhuwentaonis]MBT1018561.1 type 2 isopentenyl-diphosphate Delta-isomerase [Canibacter zhuwentaonis]MBT1035756.1 type 2 isopentenyl-diphosphate Delta-isomerase [Canibacter zhuwentaonis]